MDGINDKTDFYIDDDNFNDIKQEEIECKFNYSLTDIKLEELDPLKTDTFQKTDLDNELNTFKFHTNFLKENITENQENNNLCSDNKEASNNVLPVLTKKILTWPSDPLDTGPRRSAFQPYKPTTVLTNLQRGNIQAKTLEVDETQCTWHMKAGRGDLRLEDIINIPDINETDEYGMTGLMWSAAYGQTTTVQRLLEKGCDPRICAYEEQTALHLAAYGGHFEIMKQLIAYGADVNAVDMDGNTPLMYAVYEDHTHAVYELLVNDADLFILNNSDNHAYKLAIERSSNQAKLILENHMVHVLSTSMNA